MNFENKLEALREYTVRYRVIEEHHTDDLYAWQGHGATNMQLDPGVRKRAPRFTWDDAMLQVERIRYLLIEVGSYNKIEVQICVAATWRVKKRFFYLSHRSVGVEP